MILLLLLLVLLHLRRQRRSLCDCMCLSLTLCERINDCVNQVQPTVDVDVEVARHVRVTVGVADDTVVSGVELGATGRGARVRQHGVRLPDELGLRPRDLTDSLRTVRLQVDVLRTAPDLDVLGCGQTGC